MLRDTIDRWHREATEKGHKEGIEEGQIKTLSAILEARYGPDEERTARLEAMSSERLFALAVAFGSHTDATEDELFELTSS